MFKLIEGDDGLITVTTSGHWSADELRRFWAEVELMIARLRQRHARVIVMIDASDGTIIAADGGLDVPEPAKESFDHWALLLTEPADRLTLIVPSSLAKHGMKAAFDDPRFMTFMSASAARTWAFAYG